VRGGNLDVFTVAADGSAEARLTTHAARDDGPEYSPDGQFIYFHSSRTGRSQIWRMRADGTEAEQLTNDELDNRFAHVSPDGKSLVFLSSEPGAEGGPALGDVALRIMTLATRRIEAIAQLTGGQGTINANSWSPDGEYLAFVSYQVVRARSE
jgi:Tol biopolymer transport system component